MTVTSNTAAWSFVASGATGDFAVPAPVLATADLDCYALDQADGTRYAPTFTVELASDFSGATVHVTAGLTAGDTVVVRRLATGLQPTPYLDGGRFPASSVERMLDRLCTYILAQQLDFARSVRADPSDPAIDPLPPAAQRLGKFLAFDLVNGAPMLAEGAEGGGLISAAMADVVGQATLAEARTAMGVPAALDVPTLAGANTFTGDNTFDEPVSITDAVDPDHAVSLLQALTLDAAQAAARLVGDRQRIWGLTYARNGTDASNDIDVAVGGCMSDDGTMWLPIAATTKQLDVAWAADNGATPTGGLDTGAVGDNPYYAFAIGNPTTAATGVLFSLSATAPTMPSGYTKKRLFGYVKRVSSANVAFTTSETAGGGLRLLWTTPTLDGNETLSTSRATVAAKVPLDFKTQALLRVQIAHATTGTIAWVGDPAETDAAPSFTASPLATHHVTNANGSDFKDMAFMTSAAGLVAARSSAASTNWRFVTRGFEWSRR